MFEIKKIEKINKRKANKPLTIRLPEDMYEQYKYLSNHSNQSMNSLFVAALRYALNNMKDF